MHLRIDISFLFHYTCIYIYIYISYIYIYLFMIYIDSIHIFMYIHEHTCLKHYCIYIYIHNITFFHSYWHIYILMSFFFFHFWNLQGLLYGCWLYLRYATRGSISNGAPWHARYEPSESRGWWRWVKVAKGGLVTWRNDGKGRQYWVGTSQIRRISLAPLSLVAMTPCYPGGNSQCQHGTDSCACNPLKVLLLAGDLRVAMNPFLFKRPLFRWDANFFGGMSSLFPSWPLNSLSHWKKA